MRKVTTRIILIISFISTGIVILGSTNNFNDSGRLSEINRLTKVSVYYESLCPFSVSFITTQLYPNYDNLKDYIQIEWIPYGWTKRSTSLYWNYTKEIFNAGKLEYSEETYVKNLHIFYITAVYTCFKLIGYHQNGVVQVKDLSLINDKLVFTCQHGDDECSSNKYQACALFQNESQDQNVEFINCVLLLDNPSDAESVENCATLHDFNWNAIATCFNTSEGSELMVELAEKTHNLSPKLLLIPTVIYNDHFDRELDKRITSHFLETTCLQIPNPKPNICL